MSKQKFNGGFRGKGYYIALILCAAAIGITGYVFYRNNRDAEPQLQNPPSVTSPADSAHEGEDVQAVATQPTQGMSETVPAETTAPQKRPLKTAAPVEGQTIADYAMDCLSYNQTTRDWRTHNGIDIGAESGTKVCAAADGTVYTVYEDELMGTVVVIRHEDGYTTQYASLAKEVSVAPGDEVVLGQTIGFVGQTALLESAVGEHVHFSVICNGEAIDPAEFLNLQ